jgi:hypothetical protein
MKPYPLNWEPIYIETEQTPLKAHGAYKNKESLYGITKQQFLQLAYEQGYRCAVCDSSSEDAPYRLAIDHNHTTNEIRGLLCSNCNYGLGIMNDDADRLEKAAQYLKQGGTGVFVKFTGSKEII